MTLEIGDRVYVKSISSEFYGVIRSGNGIVWEIWVDFSRKPCRHLTSKRDLNERDVCGYKGTRPIHRQHVFPRPVLKDQIRLLWDPLVKSLAGP
jgi:hypothetical protein